ncbi:type I polyketide synthase [Cellulosilyticum ruminicola]|uniref:type I polyketide synthase n=1 Tax=Cellulosilyticum ruminicola TaxID=425254 RepID=UPI0006D0E167|nr:type I polyketide synthase [Cellulosilyticum ruminicola]
MENEQSKLLRKALTVIKNLQEQLKQEEHSEDKEEIAVIGMACRFPGGCNSPEEYWELLKEGKECVIDVPKERWDISAYSGEEACVLEQMYVYQSNFLQRDVSEFDAKFFRILPTEANAMDPQQRQLLEVCWEALENSGQNPVELKGSHTGVFIGISSNCEYAMLPQDQKGVNQYTGTGTTSSIAAGRISYTFGWNGPSISLDTACSSSLVSTHLAVQSLRKKECDLAISGGVNLMLSPVVYSNLCMMNAVSADGRSKPFDANGSGYGRGEGCGILVLKRLKDAMRDGDTVYAVIKGGAINNDGASSGLTVPNGKAQKMVMEDALKDAGVAPHEMSYLEAHGTGTPLGDPIEIGAVTEVFGQDNLREAPLIIGAVKGNIGHLESAAGVASLIKVVLSLYHKEIPRIVNFNELNPRLNLGKIPAILPREHMVWESHNKRRLAGISSFGFSGTNAHIVMGEAKQEEITQDMRDHFNNCLICLSAKSEQSLIEMIKKYEAFLKLQPQISLKDISYVANACHATYRHRAVFMGDNHEKLLEAFRETLAQIDQKRTIYNNEVAADEVKTVGEAKDVFARYCNNRVYASKVDDQTQPKFAFILGGEINSLQYISSELYHSFLEYKEYFNECIAYFEEYHGIEIKDKFFTNQRLTQKAADACLFATQYAMMMLFKKLNIKPEIIVGERVGQLVAATVAEIINLQDAVRLFIALNKIANECQDVAFARVYLNKDEVMDLINNWEGNLCISAIYSENECIISGKERDIDQIIAQGIDATKESGKKWPSKFYADYMSKFEQELGDITYKKPKCRYIAQASGVAINNNQKLDTSFWKESLLHPIRYDKAAEFLYNQAIV